MRTLSQKTTEKYLNFLHSLKEKIDSETEFNSQEFFIRHKVSSNWMTFLTRNDVIYKRKGLLYWNEKIPVSLKLVEKFRENRNKQYIDRSLKVQNKPTINFDEENIKELVYKFSPIIEDKKVGVIRKFLRWLW